MKDGRRIAVYVALIAGAVAGRLYGRRGSFGLPYHLAWDRAVLKQWQYSAALVAWVAFSAYWEYAKRNAAEAVKSESKTSRAVHVILTNIAALLVVLPFVGLGRALPMSQVVMTLGLAITWAGLALAIWARRHLGVNWSGEITIKKEHTLVRTGPYARLRHPIYTGLLAMYVGTAIVTGEWLAVVGAVMAIFAYWRKVRLEERNLVEAFGTGWEDYRRETWALVPGVY